MRPVKRLTQYVLFALMHTSDFRAAKEVLSFKSLLSTAEN